MKKNVTLINKICKKCGKEFIVNMSHKTQNFCNKECFKKFNNGIGNPFYGKKHTEKEVMRKNI
jgi:hypothetical protein